MNHYGWVSVDEFGNKNFQRFVHPDYAEKVQKGVYKDYVFQCMAILDNDYLELSSTEVRLVLKKEVFRVMPVQPKYKPLETVKLLNSKGVLEIGIIRSISWHNNNQKHVYSIEVNNKLKSKRYFEESLEKIPSNANDSCVS